MLTRRPTIIDVAKAAGVSKSTVSLVLQESPLVRDETRALVRETMASIGYVYNRAAANMRSSNVGLIGLVINDLRNPFFTEFATSAQMAFSERGYATVVANTDENPELQAEVVASMIEHGVSGLMICPAYGNETQTFDLLERARVPVMQVLRQVDHRTDIFPFASMDNVKGSYDATRHLIESGAKRIAFIGGLAERAITIERMSGYLAALKEAGLEPLALPGRPSRAFGQDAASTLMRDFPDVTAALCFSDLVALGMLSGFARAGCLPGRDFNIVGFDDIEECAQVWPQLSSVGGDIANFSRRTAISLVNWIENNDKPNPVMMSPVRLIIRASSGGHV
jgi:LacI family transcriptional regulator